MIENQYRRTATGVYDGANLTLGQAIPQQYTEGLMPRQVSGIEVEFNRLSNEIGRLDKITNQLVSRLVAVTRSTPKNGNCDEGKAQSSGSSQLADEIGAKVRHLASLNASLENLLADLDL